MCVLFGGLVREKPPLIHISGGFWFGLFCAGLDGEDEWEDYTVKEFVCEAVESGEETGCEDSGEDS